MGCTTLCSTGLKWGRGLSFFLAGGGELQGHGKKRRRRATIFSPPLCQGKPVGPELPLSAAPSHSPPAAGVPEGGVAASQLDKHCLTCLSAP